MENIKYFYGIFEKDGDFVTVSIPDVEVCETFGVSWDDAYENAIDALAGCLSIPETKVRERTPKSVLEKANPNAQVIPVPVDEEIKRKYEPKKRFNAMFPESLLRRVDAFRAITGQKRSAFLAAAAETYIKKVEKNDDIQNQ